MGRCPIRRPASSAACSSPATSPRSRSGPRSPTGIDARKVYLAGSLLAAAGSAGFGLAASGFASAVLFQALLGVGIAAHLHAGAAPALGPHLRPAAEPLHRVLHVVLRHRHRALARHARASSRRASAGARRSSLRALGPLLAGALVWFLIERHRRRRRSRVFARALFPVAAWRKVLADRAARRLHLRLLRALPGAVRLAGLDGGVSRFFLDAAGRQAAFRGRRRRSPRW